MNIKEAFDEIESAAYLGTEEDLKKHTEALKIIGDNLKLNNLNTTDIIKDYFNNSANEDYETIELNYDDFEEIAEKASWEISQSRFFDDIVEIITDCIYEYIEQRKTDKEA